MTRRAWLAAAAAGKAVRLSLGTYGMRELPVDRALALIRETGYAGAELCLMPGWPSEPARLDAAARRRIRGAGLPVATLLEGFDLLAPAAEHARTLDRIRAAADVAHEAAPGAILQSVLGGRPAAWETQKEAMAARLAEWARVAADSGLRLAVKAHVGSAADTPEKLLWLLDRVRNPALAVVYDYSHFQLLGRGLEETLDVLLPRSAFVTVKDARRENGQPRFLLPGDGTVDYGHYGAQLKARGYRGWMLVEISRQLQTQAGYDAAAAARRSYAFLALRLRAAGLQ